MSLEICDIKEIMDLSNKQHEELFQLLQKLCRHEWYPQETYYICEVCAACGVANEAGQIIPVHELGKQS